MAKAGIYVTGLEEMAQQIEQCGAAGDEICKRAVYEGAGILADAIRKNLEEVIKKGGKSTGELVASLGIAKIKVVKSVGNTSIGFDGYDSKGVPNAIKARVLESGRSDQPGRKDKGFIRHAINATKDKAEKTMVEEAEKTIAEKLK